MKNILFVIFLFALSSCATNSDLIAKVESKASCCKTFNEFTYESFSAGNPIRITFNDQSPVFEFESGKSYFKALRLPTPSTRFKLRVKSNLTGSVAFETVSLSQSFCPTARFLDENFTTINSRNEVPIQVRGLKSFSYLSEFTIPPNAKFVVLHTDPTRYFMSALRSTSGDAYLVNNAVVYDAVGETTMHPCGPIADAEVELL